jgi:hypothetical protein
MLINRNKLEVKEPPREPTAGQKIPFDLTFTKDEKTYQDEIAVDRYNDLRNPHYKQDPTPFSPEAFYGQQALTDSDNERAALVESAEQKILGKLQDRFGNNFSGVKVDIELNYNELIDDNKIINECISIANDSDPNLLKNKDGLEKVRKEVAKSLAWYKKEYGFRGYENSEAGKPIGIVKDKIEYEIWAVQDTKDAMLDVKAHINKTIRGYEFTHHVKANEQPYFIVINKADGQEKVTTTAVDKSLPLEEQKRSIQKGAQEFVFENVKNSSQLKNISVRLEKANDITDTNQREYYQQIGHRENFMSMQNSIEIAK